MKADEDAESIASRALLAPTSEEQFENVDVLVGGISEPVASGLHLTIQRISSQRWVGSINLELSSYHGAELELRIHHADGKTERFPVSVGPRIRNETLLTGTQPSAPAATAL